VRPIFLLLLFSLLVTGASAESSLRSARQAQALLGPGTWSRVVHIENSNTHGTYPHRLYALVFEFSGILWFYTETNGTQSFSLWTHRLEAEKADFRPGLLAIDPGFTRYSILEDTAPPTSSRGELPNGCLIESLVAGRDRLTSGGKIRSARLVMYYARERQEGHCVLAYEATDGIFVLDPTREQTARRIGGHWPRDPVELAQAAWPSERRSEIKEARTLDFPLSSALPASPSALAALTPGAGEGTFLPRASAPGHG